MIFFGLTCTCIIAFKTTIFFHFSFRFSKYIRPITKTAASLGFLYVGLTCGLVQCDQGNYVFLGGYFFFNLRLNPNKNGKIPNGLQYKYCILQMRWGCNTCSLLITLVRSGVIRSRRCFPTVSQATLLPSRGYFLLTRPPYVLVGINFLYFPKNSAIMPYIFRPAPSY